MKAKTLKNQKKVKGLKKDFYALILREIKKGHTVFVDVVDSSFFKKDRSRIITKKMSEFSYNDSDTGHFFESCFFIKVSSAESLISKMKNYDSNQFLKITGAVVLDTGKYL